MDNPNMKQVSHDLDDLIDMEVKTYAFCRRKKADNNHQNHSIKCLSTLRCRQLWQQRPDLLTLDPSTPCNGTTGQPHVNYMHGMAFSIDSIYQN